MATPTIKCKCCGERVPREKAIKIKDKFYVCSEECQKDFYKSDEYFKDKLYCRVLPYYEDVKDQYSKDGVFLKLQQQLEKAVREYGMKLAGINLTLDYYLNVLGKTYDNQYGLGQFLKYYGDAKDYYNRVRAVKKTIANLPLDFFQTEKYVVAPKKEKSFTEIYKDNVEDL